MTDVFVLGGQSNGNFTQSRYRSLEEVIAYNSLDVHIVHASRSGAAFDPTNGGGANWYPFETGGYDVSLLNPDNILTSFGIDMSVYSNFGVDPVHYTNKASDIR